MPKTPIPAFLLSLLLGMTCNFSARAQLFKNLANAVKNSGRNNSSKKTDNSSKDATSGSSDAATPADTSSAAFMKRLGLITGAGGVSASDSAAAINTFRNGSGGSGFYYQYLNTIISRKGGTARDTSYRWLTNNGEGRSEMRIMMPGAATGRLIVIGRASQPKYSVLLDPDEKGYSLNIIDTALINSRSTSYAVTKIGDETVNGYACAHVKMISTTGSGLFKSSSTTELWTSKSVPGYALYHNLTDQTQTYGMMQALEKIGAGGVLVRMTGSGKDYSMTYELIRAQSGSYPASQFIIPSGYINNNKTIMEYMLSGVKQNNVK
ncbi:MAG TPA: DUF4412 domain-containing protein [Puia sp.]|jgi:hypothetical protein